MDAAGVSGPNLEGKEQRFGIASSSLFAAVTTAASCGAVNAAMESLTGLGGAVPMSEMMTGEVIWGGVGSGLYGMLLFVILGVFISGLMVGRTPEFLGKKIEAREIKLTVIGTIAVPMMVLVTTALAIGSKWGAPSIYNSGPQGFSETLYAYVSQGNNNGSAFAGYTGYLQPNGTNDGAFGISFADLLGGVAMLGGRFLPLLAALAIAGLAGRQARVADRPRHAAHRHADLRGRPDLGDPHRRAADLRPRPAPRTRGPGPDRPALLAMRELRAAAIALVAISLVFGLAYPLAMTGVGQVVFGGAADGSLVKRDGKVVGSKLIGQDFSRDLRYFQSRPSATDYSAERHVLQQPRARTRRTSPTSCRKNLRAYLRPRAASTRTARSQVPVRRGHHLRLGRRPGHLRGQRAHPGPPRRRAARALPRAACWSCRRPHEPAAVRPRPARARSTCSS